MKSPPGLSIVRRETLSRFWPETLPIVSMSDEEWGLLERLANAPWICPLSEIAEGRIGEANSGHHKPFMVDADTGTLLIRGTDLSPYHIETQGTYKRWIDKEGFLSTLTPLVRKHLEANRIRVVKQAVRNISMPKRLVAALAEPEYFLADSTDYFIPRSPYHPAYLLALLNSRSVPEWLYQAVSTNNNVNLYQVRHVPVPRIDFEMPEDRRTSEAASGWTKTQRFLNDLPLKSGSVFDVEASGAGRQWNEWLEGWLSEGNRQRGLPCVLHDLLVRLAEEMMEMKRQEHLPETILDRAEGIALRCRQVEGVIDYILGRMYGLEEREIAALARRFSVDPRIDLEGRNG
jgi:hypothetical protein